MKRPDFLNRLRKEGKLRMVEPSVDICNSYLKKAERSIKAAKLLSDEELYEESITTAYYAIYNSITAFLFRIGIRCQNHSVSLVLLKKLTKREDLYKMAMHAKEERVKKQYFVSSDEEMRVMETSAKAVLEDAESFIIEIKLIIEKLDNGDIAKIRKNVGMFIK